MTNRHSRTESLACDPLLGPLHVHLLAFGDAVRQHLWLEHTRCTTAVGRCVSSCASRSLSDGVSGTATPFGHNIRFWHRLIQLLVPRILCLHNFVRADQHWFLRQTVREFGDVYALISNTSPRVNSTGIRFSVFLSSMKESCSSRSCALSAPSCQPTRLASRSSALPCSHLLRSR